MKSNIVRICELFNCDRRHGNFCCYDCGYKRTGRCSNPCLNDPTKCGYMETAAKYKVTRKTPRR